MAARDHIDGGETAIAPDGPALVSPVPAIGHPTPAPERCDIAIIATDADVAPDHRPAHYARD
jgi:hypothetical protein